MSYIVKNCPARPIIWNNNWCNKEQQFCQNCTDCVVKQVIEISKDIIEKDCYENSDVKAEKILQLLDIGEVNK